MLCLAVALTTVPGCRGCRGDKTPEEIAREKEEEERRKKEEEEKKKPDFEVDPPLVRPHEPIPDRDQANRERCWYKPGHWSCATLQAKTNHFNLVGELETEVLDRRGTAVGLEGMPFIWTGSRRIALPEKQPKQSETLFFVPYTESQPQLSIRIRGRKASRGLYEAGEFLWPMKSYQHFFVVLASAPGDYGYLKKLDSIRYPQDLSFGDPSQAYYFVRLVEASRQTPLPSHPLYWTGIAYFLVGQFEVETLARSQQQALLDWVHWGGQLIASGPESLETLRHTLLADYLPATRKDTRELTPDDFDELNRHWTLPVHGQPGRLLRPVQPWAGIELEKHPEAREVLGTGGLLVERRVGRGRILVSAFRLNERELINWPSFDGFFNACVLARPPRVFDNTQGQVGVAWTSATGRDRFDPRVLTGLRYFTRDSGRKIDVYHPPDDASDMIYGYTDPGTMQTVDGTSIASWNDFSPVADVARHSLGEAAAIEIPDRSFVVWVVGGYLLVLVPLNWLVCRLLGRVELAWVAAPVIAVVWTGLVIRMARLDIGFARSQTEIRVVELQGDYERAHVTRYYALYTSLFTSYRMRCDDPGALMLPFPEQRGADEFRFGLRKLQFRYGKGAELDGLSIRSNSTGFAHSEQMVDVGGPIRLDRSTDGVAQVMNETGLTLHDAAVLRRNGDGELEVARIATLEPGDTAVLDYRRTSGGQPLFATAGASDSDRPFPPGLDLRELMNIAALPQDLARGEQRLLAWSTDVVPGITVEPAAPQLKTAALIIAHLEYESGREPQPDENTRGDVDRDAPRFFTPREVEIDPVSSGSS